MELTQKAKEGLEARVKSLEDLIERKGIGSRQLTKARKTQRYVNLTVLAVSTVAVVGLVTWLSKRRNS